MMGAAIASCFKIRVPKPSTLSFALTPRAPQKLLGSAVRSPPSLILLPGSSWTPHRRSFATLETPCNLAVRFPGITFPKSVMLSMKSLVHRASISHDSPSLQGKNDGRKGSIRKSSPKLSRKIKPTGRLRSGVQSAF